MTEQPPRKKARLCFTDDVEVLVGPTRKRFVLHKSMICARSTFFEAACSQRWNENKAPINLEDESPQVFDIYLYYIYKGVIEVIDIGEEELHHPQTQTMLRLVGTYLLADKLGDVLAANAMIDEIVRFSDEEKLFPGYLAAAYVSRQTHTNSPLRQLFIDYYVYEASKEAIPRLCENPEVSRSFISEVLREMHRIMFDNRDRKVGEVFDYQFTSKNKCRYHQHDKTHPTCGTDCKMEPSNPLT